jgi:hypothetical protein
MPYITLVCVCVSVWFVVLLCYTSVCMSLLQAAFSSASATPECPSWAAKCSAVYPSCKDEGVSRQSGARMLHCCLYRESNTQIEEGGKNQGIRFTQPSSCIHTQTHARNMFSRQKNTSSTHKITSFRKSGLQPNSASEGLIL